MSTRQRAQRGETTEFSGRVRHWERVQRYQKTNPLNPECIIDYGWISEDNGGSCIVLFRWFVSLHSTAVRRNFQLADKMKWIGRLSFVAGNHEISPAQSTGIKKEKDVPRRNLQHISCLATWSHKKEKEPATATEGNERNAGGLHDLEHDAKQKKLKLKING